MKNTLDILWVLLCSGLVFTMQAGFLCLESGLTRSKNAINVALKNVADFTITVCLFWFFGFGLMFGSSYLGLIGTDAFSPDFSQHESPWPITFFIFEVMFCATSATIVSGAVAERMRFPAYLASTLLISSLIYPIFGHWAWAGLFSSNQGWLEAIGFVDFAGSTAVHSVGGWVSLAAVLHLGPRLGRFVDDRVHNFPAGNLPVAMLGVMLLFFGWFGFNGGSAMGMSAQVPKIILNTTLAGCSGMLMAQLVGWRVLGYPDVLYALNGVLAGLVAVTAGAHAYSPSDALIVGAIGGMVIIGVDYLLVRLRIDDAVGAIPVHLGAGVWGTLAVALFGQPEALHTGLNFWGQLHAQAVGIAACALWSFSLAWVFFWIINCGLLRLRVSDEGERLGLNVYEHGARTELVELLETMRTHEEGGDLSVKVPVEPFTEVGEIAANYNRVVSALERAVNQTQVIVRNLRDGMITYTRDGIITGVNPGAEAIFARPASDLVGQSVAVLFGSTRPSFEALHGLLEVGYKREFRVRTPKQQLRVVEILVSEGLSGSESAFTGMVRDVTERKRLEEQLHRERDQALVTLASIGDGVITTDEAGNVQYLNPVAERLTGWSSGAAQGMSILRVYHLIDELSGEALENPIRVALGQGRSAAQLDHRMLVSREGNHIPVLDTAAPIRSRDGYIIGAVLVFHDVTLTRDLARELSHQAAHDALTGLVNRREFERRIGLLLEDPRRERRHVLCYLDLDQFKIVNDTCGHAAGDELLRQVSSLVQERVRKQDVLARLGGDEFGIVFLDCDVEHALHVADGLRQAIQDFRFGWEDKVFSIGVSIGLVAVDQQGDSLGSLLSAADAACYAAKEAGRNRVHIYQPDDRQLLERHGQMQWVTRLQSALDQDHLRLYAQPIMLLHGESTLQHYEILLRIEEEGRIVEPGSFMPAAERYNMMPRIDEWVVSNVLAWLSDRCRKGQDDTRFLVNLSGSSLSDDRFRRVLLERVQSAQLPEKVLCFELTESAAVANLTSLESLIRELRQLGCAFALDDFGSGLSSFGYLKNLSVDYLKIDGSFVRDILNDPIDMAMVESINTIGHIMGLLTIAESVENAAVLEQLQRIGVDYAQGYHCGRPQPLTEIDSVRLMPR